jgi:hypothetical protein
MPYGRRFERALSAPGEILKSNRGSAKLFDAEHGSVAARRLLAFWFD